MQLATPAVMVNYKLLIVTIFLLGYRYALPLRQNFMLKSRMINRKGKVKSEFEGRFGTEMFMLLKVLHIVYIKPILMLIR